jgi:hypothetical protein
MVRANESGDPQTHPQEVTREQWDVVCDFLESRFRAFGYPDGLVIYRMDLGEGRPRYPMAEYHMQPDTQSRKGRPVAYEDPTYHYARTVATLRRYHPDAPAPDLLVAGLLGVHVRTLEGWRHDGKIGGGRKRRA